MRAVFSILACGAALGCSSDALTHNPPADTTCHVHCDVVDHTGIGPGGLVDGGISTVTDGGQGTGNLNGIVTVFRDAEFINRTPFTGDGTMVVRGAHDVTGAFSGSSFSIDHTDAQKPVWVGLTATTNATDLIPTIMPVDGTATSVEVTFGRTSDLLSIIAGFTQNSQTMLSTAAQIVVEFQDANAKPVSGVGIVQVGTVAAPPTMGILYDAGSAYSDSATNPPATSARGVAVIVNAPASAAALPGAIVPITYTSPTGKPGTFSVYAAKGALTVVIVTSIA